MQQKSVTAQLGSAVPPGHVRTNEKWRGSMVVQSLQGSRDWKHPECLYKHEKILEHRNCMLAWIRHAKSICAFCSASTFRWKQVFHNDGCQSFLTLEKSLRHKMEQSSRFYRSSVRRKLRLLFEEQLGLVDFQLSNRSCILYISETDLVAGSAYKRKLVQFRKACPQHSTVLVERTAISEQYFLAVQQFAVLGLGVTLMPVISQAEAALVIIHLAGEHCKENTGNPFLPRHNPPGLMNGQVLESILKVPGIGQVKALALLNYFPSLLKLSTASEDELAEAVGPASAKNIHRFFT